MRLSELRKVLKKAEELAIQLGNDDPDITFWHEDQETDCSLDIVVNPVLDDCMVISTDNPGNFSFRLVEKEN